MVFQNQQKYLHVADISVFSLISKSHLPLVNWVSIDSDNGLSPDRRQAITWNNAHLLSIRPKGTKFS